MATFHVQAKDVIYRIHDVDTINGMQNFNWDPAFNEEFLEELGNPSYSGTSVEPEVSGSFDVTSTGGAVALLTKMIMTLDGSGGFTGYKFLPGTPNVGTINPADLEFAVFDLIGPIVTNGAWNRSEFFPRVFLSSLSFSGDASGNAAASYNFEGQLAEVYRNPAQDIITKIATYTSATTFTLSDTAYRLDSEAGETSVTPTPTNTYIAALIDDQVYDDSFLVDIDDQVGAGPVIITMTAAAPVPVGARITVLAYADTAGTFPVVVNPQSANFVRANQMDLWLVSVATIDIDGLADGALQSQAFADNDAFLRVQSFDINIDLRREALRQIKQTGSSSIYFRAATFPLQVTGSASTFASDLQDWATIIGEDAAPTDPFDNKIDIAKFEGITYQLVARYYFNGTPMQTIAFIDATVTGMSTSTGVGGRTEVNWSFSGSNFRIEGVDV